LELSELLSVVDVLSIHAPLTEETERMIGIAQLKQMKKSAIIVNTSRGGIVIENELELALESQLVSGAALDVFYEEPYVGALRTLPNVILTPHAASHTIEARHNMMLESVSAISSHFNVELKKQITN
jgi:phosphoglycerate dehydrogenase-like enzyme